MERWIPSYGAGGSLSQAWAYFEHVILPRRRLVSENGKTHYVKAAPGDDETLHLYPAWCTPVRQFEAFGTGVAVYFETLLALSVLCLVAGLLYLPSIHYYASDGYTSQQIYTVTGALRGSLLCPSPVWAPCPECEVTQWQDSPDRYSFSADGLVFALKNTCAPLRWSPQGWNHLLVMGFLAVGMFVIGYYQRKLELAYDESVLTASDFSIQVDNPPADATDPDEWKAFFGNHYGAVVYVTVALDNSDLLKQLGRRRAALQRASYKLPRSPGPSTPLQHIPVAWEKDRPLPYKRLTKLDETCRRLIQTRTFPTSAVFVTFDREADQRKCLAALRVGNFNVLHNQTDALTAAHCFRGNLVLDVCETTEPSAIRWQDLDETFMTKLKERFVSGALTLAVMLFGF